MRQKLFIFIGVILISLFSAQLISCDNKEQDEISVSRLEPDNILQKYGSIHNSGLEYIKLNAEKTSGKYTKSCLDSVFAEWVIGQYGKNEAAKILQEIGSQKELVFNGMIPSLARTRSGEVVDSMAQTNAFAQKALSDCMDKIRVHLNKFDDDEIFDNAPLVNDLHTIINGTYTVYAKECSSITDAKALDETLGVLYGSTEYWSNSDNVASWSKVYLEEGASSGTSSTAKETEKKKKKLSKSEFLQAVASADAIGAIGGSLPMAAACSAAAALYFDVE